MGRQTSCCLSCNVNSKKLIIVTDRFFFSFSGICEVSFLFGAYISGILSDLPVWPVNQCPQKSVIEGMNPFYWGGFAVTLQFLATLALFVQAEVFCG